MIFLLAVDYRYITGEKINFKEEIDNLRDWTDPFLNQHILSVFCNVLKPLICHGLFIIFNFKTNRGYFTQEIFFTRVLFDLASITIDNTANESTSKLNNLNFKDKYFLISLIPLICEPFIFILSVRVAEKRSRRFLYRLIKADIKTWKENYDMWSTDDSEPDEDEVKEEFVNKQIQIKAKELKE